MLVTFSCDVYADTTYFGDVAKNLLKMMGHSGTIPGALLADDVPRALERLQNAVEQLKAVPAPDTKAPEGTTEQDDWKEKPVTMVHRALPLIDLLKAAAKAHCNVMWEGKGK